MEHERHRVAIGQHGGFRLTATHLDSAVRTTQLRAEIRHRRLHQRSRVDRLDAVRARTGLELSEFEQVLDEPLQPPALGGQRLVVLLATGFEWHAALRQQLRELPHRCQRRAELMGDGRHEVRLRAGQRHLAPDGAADEIGRGQKEGQHHAEGGHDQAAATHEAVARESVPVSRLHTEGQAGRSTFPLDEGDALPHVGRDARQDLVERSHPRG